MSNSAPAYRLIPFAPKASAPAPEVERLLNQNQVAEVLAVSKRTVEALIAAGRLKALKINQLVRVDPRDLRDYIEKSKT
jgi:excisionase family DNA binding protein